MSDNLFYAMCDAPLSRIESERSMLAAAAGLTLAIAERTAVSDTKVARMAFALSKNIRRVAKLNDDSDPQIAALIRRLEEELT